MNACRSVSTSEERTKAARALFWQRTGRLPASVIPPFWHRHSELLGELSASHLHWPCAYDPEQNGSTPLGAPAGAAFFAP